MENAENLGFGEITQAWKNKYCAIVFEVPRIVE